VEKGQKKGGEKKKKKEKKRGKPQEKQEKAREQTPPAHHSFSVIVFVRQEARVSYFLVFCFISCKTGSAGVSSLVLQLREL
jgi:hypothetical protein